jgi:hypothetical protein
MPQATRDLKRNERGRCLDIDRDGVRRRPTTIIAPQDGEALLLIHQILVGLEFRISRSTALRGPQAASGVGIAGALGAAPLHLAPALAHSVRRVCVVLVLISVRPSSVIAAGGPGTTWVRDLRALNVPARVNFRGEKAAALFFATGLDQPGSRRICIDDVLRKHRNTLVGVENGFLWTHGVGPWYCV